jgi:hypothetical protein
MDKEKRKERSGEGEREGGEGREAGEGGRGKEKGEAALPSETLKITPENSVLLGTNAQIFATPITTPKLSSPSAILQFWLLQSQATTTRASAVLAEEGKEGGGSREEGAGSREHGAGSRAEGRGGGEEGGREEGRAGTYNIGKWHSWQRKDQPGSTRRSRGQPGIPKRKSTAPWSGVVLFLFGPRTRGPSCLESILPEEG